MLKVYTLSCWQSYSMQISFIIHMWLVIAWCRYHLKDVIVGKIYFILVRIKIKHMEVQIIRREIAGSG